MSSTQTRLGTPDAALLDDAAEAYVGYLVAAYGFARDDVTLPDAYIGRELDWFGHINEVLNELDGYTEAEVRRILTGHSPWVPEGSTLLAELRGGAFERVLRVLKRY